MKKRYLKAVMVAIALASAFGMGMLYMYFIMWTDTFVKFIEMTERVFQ